MKKCSVSFYHKSVSKTYDKIIGICEKLELNLFESDNLSISIGVEKSVKPLFIFIDGEGLPTDMIHKYMMAHKEQIFFIITEEVFLQVPHSYIVSNEQELVDIFCKKYKNLFVKETDINKYNKCLAYVSEQLKTIGFSSKHLGSTYLRDLITELTCDRYLVHSFYKNIYEILSHKYLTTPENIERTIRFCIKSAYNNKKYDILKQISSRANKPPSIKEISNHILDKIIIEQAMSLTA